MTDQFDKATFLLAARFAHVTEAFSVVHYGVLSGATWQGTIAAGELCFDNGSGDYLVAAWSSRGLVGLLFAHESTSPRLRFDERARNGFFGQIPEVLVDLVRDAVQWAGGAFTSAFWAIGDDLSTPCDALDLVLPSSDFSFDAECLRRWAEQRSLDVDQVDLALRLARGPWDITLGSEETEMIVRVPADSGEPVEDREGMERAAEMLREVGITWSPPFSIIEQNQRAHEERRKARAVEAQGEPSAGLFESVRSGDVASVQRLLAAGADVNVTTIEDQFEWTPAGDTPLIQAAKKGHTDVVAVLVEAGAEVNSVNRHDQSAVYWAVRSRLPETVKVLSAAGADLEHPDDNGWTPLHFAAADGFDELVELLLAAGVTRDPRNQNGHRPRDIARMRGQKRVLRLLSRK